MMDSDKVKGVDIFQGVPMSGLNEIIKLCEEVEYEKDTFIFQEGQPAEFFYILESGRIDLRFEFPLKDSSKEMTITTVSGNRSFGWSAILEPHIFTLSAYCAESCKAIRISGQKFLDLCETLPNFGVYVMKNLATIISQRLIAHQEQIKKEIGDYLITKW